MLAGPAAAVENTGYKTVGGLTVYLGVMPSALLRGEVEEHAEAAHGDVPRDRHRYHVLVAVFDAASGRRVEDAVVEARVTPLGLGPVVRQLQPMSIAEAVTYGNYFIMPDEGQYRIVFTITTKSTPPVSVEFLYEHRIH